MVTVSQYSEHHWVAKSVANGQITEAGGGTREQALSNLHSVVKQAARQAEQARDEVAREINPDGA